MESRLEEENLIVIGVTGHQKLPAEARPVILSAIERAIGKHGSVVGISSLADGADQLFAEVVVAKHKRLHAVIPCREYERSFQNASALQKFNTLVSQAEDVETLDYAEPSEEAFFQAGKRVVELSDILLAIWDGAQAKGHGGTAEIVQYARQQGKTVSIIWPSGLKR